MPKKNLSLDDTTISILDEAENASAYVRWLVEVQRRRVQSGHSDLTAAGWTRDEIRCACDALNGVWMLGHGRQPGALAMELVDAARLNHLHQKHGVSDAQWSDRCKQVRDYAYLALAVSDIAQAFWGGDPWVMAKLE